MVAISTSGGSSRKRGSKPPTSGTGHSVRAVTSSSTPGSMMAVPPSFSAASTTAAQDARAASLEIGAHVALLQRREIAARGAQRNRLAGMEAMAARHAPGGDAEDLARHDRVAVQHDDPVHGPHELGLAVAPAHAPRDRERVERRLDDARQELGGGLARPRGPAEQGLALGCR